MRRMLWGNSRAAPSDRGSVNGAHTRAPHTHTYAGTASRSRLVVLAPPPCQRVPTKKTHEPAGITTGSDRSSGPGRRWPQRWLPGNRTVEPLSAVKASIAQIVAAANGARGRGTG